MFLDMNNLPKYPIIGGPSTSNYIEHLENSLAFACNFEYQLNIRKVLQRALKQIEINAIFAAKERGEI